MRATPRQNPMSHQSSAAGGSSSSGQSGPTDAQLMKYAACIRSHGEPNFPDPGPAPGGGFAFGVEPGLNPRSPSPQFQKAEKDCQGQNNGGFDEQFSSSPGW
jgi:hypothetical protein